MLGSLSVSTLENHRRETSMSYLSGKQFGKFRRGKISYLGLDDGEIFLSLDEVQDERVNSGKDEREEEGETVKVEVAL